MGGNVLIDAITPQEADELDALFERYAIKASAGRLRAIRPSPTGRHSYVLFKPELISR